VTSKTTSRVAFPVRRGRNAAALVLLVVLSAAALYVAYADRANLGLSHWWVAVFPLLAAVTAYRLVRPRVPLVLDSDGVHATTGQSLLGLRTTVDWRAIRKIRITPAGLILIELRDWQRWAADKPWLVRANMRTNERKHSAAVVQPMRELAGAPAAIISELKNAAPVRVEPPEGWKASS
jgi:hypothetical protein